VECRQVESSKKVWQLPSKQKQPLATASDNRSATTDSRATKNKSSTTLVSSTREFSHAAVKSGSVSSRDASRDSGSKISSTTVTRQSRNESALSVVQNNHVESSQNGKTVNKNSSKTIARSSAMENGLSSSVPVGDADTNSHPAPSGVMPGGNRRLSDINEPTKQPVSARLAAWKKKTAAMENASTLSQHSASRDKLHTISEAGGIHRHVLNDKDSHADIGLQTNTSLCASTSTGKASDSVTVTRGISDDSGKGSFPPLKDGEVRQRTLPRKVPPTKQGTVQPSGKKLGPATFGIQQKLTEMCENWKQNEIAEKSRKERAEDLAVLDNRWRNGILVDEQKEKETDFASAVCTPSAQSEIVSRTQVH